MKNIFYLFAALAFSLPHASIAAERILIDFGRSTEITASPNTSGYSWNNFSTVDGPTITTVLNRDGTTATGVTLAITDAFFAASTNTIGSERIYTTSANTAAGDFLYLQGANNTGIVKITGLDSTGATVYDFKALVTTNRTLPQKFITDYTVTGLSTSATVSLEAVGNVNNVASINGVIPNASGEIEVTVAINSGSDAYAAISVMEIIGRAPADPVTPDPVPETGPEPNTALVAPGEWSIALIPDTQYYTQSRPGMFSAQTIWLRDHIKNYNIKCAIHLGDITNNNTEAEWKAARESFGVLDGYLPYYFCGGNHDGYASSSKMNNYFDYSDYSTRPHFEGSKDVNDLNNTYHTFNIAGYDWIVLCLEWGVPDATVTWADGILTAHPNHKAILVTHAYMYNDSTRYDWATKGSSQSWNPHAYSYPGTTDGNDGQELWDNLVKKHNFVMTLNGHVLGDGTGFLTSANNAGQNVHQMLVNYQFLSPLSGNGFLRLLTIKNDGTVQVKSYSPVYNQWNTAADQEFTFDFEWYAPADANSNGQADYYDESLDSDNDGVNNFIEFITHRTDPYVEDTDGDGIADGLEIQIGTDPSVSDKKARDAILANADEFGYYNEQGIFDLNLGQMMITPNGVNFDLSLQLETTENLGTIPFAPYGVPVPWSIAVPHDKYFMRVRAKP